MADKNDVNRKFLKQALSKTKGSGNDNNSEKLIGKQSYKKQIHNRKVEAIRNVDMRQNKYTSGSIDRKILIKGQQNDKWDDGSFNHNQDHSLSMRSQIFSQKPSIRSSFSESLYTQETENIKESISKVFERKSFLDSMKQYPQFQNKQTVTLLKKNLLENEIFIFALEAKLKQKNGKQKQEALQKEVRKKVLRQIEYDENEKECYNAQNRIQNYLEQKLRRIKRKQF